METHFIEVTARWQHCAGAFFETQEEEAYLLFLSEACVPSYLSFTWVDFFSVFYFASDSGRWTSRRAGRRFFNS